MQSYNYDNLDRLIGASFTSALKINEKQNFSYDNLGNINSPTNAVADYAAMPRLFDSANRWTGYRNTQGAQVGTALFAYDGFGNPTTYQGDSLGFDRNNHLTSYSRGANLLMEAGYRSDGLRAWKESGGTRTHFLYDGSTLLAEVNETGAVTAYNTWGATGLLARTNLQTNQERWYISDPNGNVALRLDGTGQTVAADRYSSYGERVAGGEVGDPVGYKGQSGYYTDNETGLILCSHRYYDPVAGRWMTQDPIGYAGGLNVYAYCAGEPVSGVDSSGLIQWVDHHDSKNINGVVAYSHSYIFFDYLKISNNEFKTREKQPIATQQQFEAVGFYMDTTLRNSKFGCGVIEAEGAHTETHTIWCSGDYLLEDEDRRLESIVRDRVIQSINQDRYYGVGSMCRAWASDILWQSLDQYEAEVAIGGSVDTINRIRDARSALVNPRLWGYWDR